MAYLYSEERSKIFTESGQEMFLAIRDHVKETLEISGAITMGKAMVGPGDSWTMLACVDRMVELCELREIPTNGAGQDRIFVNA